MTQKMTIVDSFTDRPFAGNPAGVCILSDPREEKWMQNIAAEINLSETAFVVRKKDEFDLRWFTPTHEVDLCGHATLAGAHVLWEEAHLERKRKAVFHTRSGELTCEWKEGWIVMDFPAEPEREAQPPPTLERALGARMKYVGKNRLGYLVELESEKVVRELNPDMNELSRIDVLGVTVTSRSTMKDFDFVSRFFAPKIRIHEDPVTGAAHCCLGPYWQKRLGKNSFRAYQASKRGGELRVEVKGDRVLLTGQAVTVIRGEIV